MAQADAHGETRGRAQWNRLLPVFLGLNILWRLTRYGMDFPLWGDEARVAVNLLHRTPLELAEPLEWLQVVPLLFLWLEWGVRHTLGTGEWALRLFPVGFGIAGLIVLCSLARRLLEPRSALAGVALFAASYYPVRHATEVKPYSLDLLIAVAVLLLAWQARRRFRLLLQLTVAGTVAIWCSYTSVFVLAGAWTWLLVAWRREQGQWPRLVFAGIPILVSFAAMYVSVGRVQAEAGQFLWTLKHWDFTFPPLHDPLGLPAWLLDVHTGNLFAYPNGGNEFGSTATFVLFAVGSVVLWRGGRKDTLGLLLLPLAFNLVAACLYKYPYGGSARIAQYAAPSICLISGCGIIGIANGVRARAVEAGWLVLMAGLAVAGTVHSVAKPYKHAADEVARREIQRLAARSIHDETWVVFAAIEEGDDTWAPVLSRVQGSKGWGGSWARLQWYLQVHAPGRVRWAPDPGTLSEPVTLIAYRDDTNTFPQDRFDDYLELLAATLHEPSWTVTIPLHRRRPEALVVHGFGSSRPMESD